VEDETDTVGLEEKIAQYFGGERATRLGGKG
jgi:hypothetical protein